MFRNVAAVFACILISFNATAADRGGQFAVEGAGLGSCEHFIEARSNGDAAFHQYVGWLTGYLTAMNQYSPNTFDIAPWQSIDLLVALAEQHCRKNLKNNFLQVAIFMVIALKEDRLQEMSPAVVVKVGDTSLILYREVLRRIQHVLKRRGTYDGDLDGQFDPGTQNAIEIFQKEEQLPVTGLPDQITLLRLLRPSSDGN